MQILYGFSNCTDATYRRLTANAKVAVLQPDQKYHGLFIKGLSKCGANLLCLSGLPVNREVSKRILLREPEELEGNARYHYYTTLNLPGFRQLGIFLGAFFSVLFAKTEKETYAVCDCLNLANAFGMSFACRLRGIRLCAVVTDLPDMMYGGLTKKIANAFFARADFFLLLTEQMNGRVNRKGKPHLVLEGHSDGEDKLPPQEQVYERSAGKKVILYAGGLQKLYGILNLAEGFVKANLTDTELHIYGDGDAKEELLALSRQHPALRYCGIAPNGEIVKEEHLVSLLVNPRPAAPEYTKYSFPSKNMEYMVSGTPLLTTDLPGMPREYLPFVYLLTDESPDGIAKKLTEIFSLPLEVRRKKGAEAREFILQHKTNEKQAQKVIAFLRKGGNL